MASSLKTQASMDGSETCIDTLPPDFFEWVIDMDAAAKEVDLSKEEADRNKPSMYRVTNFARSDNPNAFTPKVISFGPFHHGSKHLEATEVDKHRALTHFLHRAGKGSEPFVSRLLLILKQLQDSYKDLGEKWIKNPSEFLKMMLLDGCFMIEVLRMNEWSNDYAPDVFSSRIQYLYEPYIKRDMLLLENQLPLLVLKALLEVENLGRTDDDYINGLVLSYINKNLKANLSTLASHPLELYRMSLLHKDSPGSPPINETKTANTGVLFSAMIENAVELWESGVHFKCKDDYYASLRDIKFDRKTGVLELPVLPVHDGTEHLLLNLVWYEKLHGGTSNDITSYVMFMAELINTADDVKLLQKKKIIINSLASHNDVAYLFHKMKMEVAYDALNDVFNSVRVELSYYYKKRRNKWRTSLWRQYLHNLRLQYLDSSWKVISFHAAALAIFLTFVQTLYSVLTFHLGK